MRRFRVVHFLLVKKALQFDSVYQLPSVVVFYRPQKTEHDLIRWAINQPEIVVMKASEKVVSEEGDFFVVLV